MAKKIYVGNLPFSTTEDTLKQMFAPYGTLGEVVVIKDRFSGRSKGFGFVTVEDDAQAAKAIAELQGKDVEGRQLTVNEARPMEEGAPRRSFGGGGGGRGGGGFGGRRERY